MSYIWRCQLCDKEGVRTTHDLASDAFQAHYMRVHKIAS